MKELSIEEKAKRYDEAVNEIKNLRDMLLKEGVINKNGIICNNFNRIFPELKESKESEDERIRQFLIHEVEETSDEIMSYRNMNKKDVIAWLEKSKTEKVYLRFKVGDVVCSSSDVQLKIIGITDYCYNCVTCATNDKYSFSFDIQDEFKLVEDEKEWSEEDENILKAILDCYKSMDLKWRNWLKSLRPQSFDFSDEELAQAEKDAFNNALDKIEYTSDEPTFADGWWAAIDFVRKKSLRPQKRWKPSALQIEALESATENCAYSEYQDCLRELIGQLKKLREE